MSTLRPGWTQQPPLSPRTRRLRIAYAVAGLVAAASAIADRVQAR